MRVLLANEGSPFTDAVLDTCCVMSEKGTLKDIRVLSLVEQAFETGPMCPVVQHAMDADRATHASAEKVAADADAAIVDRISSVGVGLSSRVAAGDPRQIILDEAKSWGAELIVIERREDRSAFGSMFDSFVDAAPCNVLVVDRRADEKDH